MPPPSAAENRAIDQLQVGFIRFQRQRRSMSFCVTNLATGKSRCRLTSIYDSDDVLGGEGVGNP